MQTNIGCNKEFAGIRPPGMTIQIDKTLTKPGYAADAAATGLVVKQAKDAISHYPIIGTNGNWFVWDANYSQYVDSGSVATFLTEIVHSLPQPGKKGVIYLVPYGEGENRYKEYIWIPDEDLEQSGCGCDHHCSNCPHHCPCPAPYPATGRYEPLGYEADLALYATMDWVENNFLSKDDESVFLAEYDFSLLSEIQDADDAGKLVACVLDGKTFTLSAINELGATFAATYLQYENDTPHIFAQILYVNGIDNWSASGAIELASTITLEELTQQLTEAKQDIEEIKQQLGQVDVTQLEQRVGILEAEMDTIQPMVQNHQDLYDALNPHVDEITNQYKVDFDVIDGNGSW
jgi:hypothetical protein